MAKKNDPDKKTKNSERKAKSEKKTKPERKDSYNFDSKTMTTYENGQEKNIPLNNKQIAELLYGEKLIIRGKNANQKELLKQISSKEITIAVGCAGTGKSYLSIAMALQLLADPNNNYQKIYIVTPNVELSGCELGWLRGGIDEKLVGFLFSTYYLIDKIIGKKNREKLVELDIISTMPVAYMRGINFDSCIVFADEMQNLNYQNFLTFITRIGYSCKYVITGDLEQIDIKDTSNGLKDAITKFKNLSEVGIVKFEKEDIVRNPLISKLLDLYQK